MSEEKPGDENAFPAIKSKSGDHYGDPVSDVWSEGGLTKRELFAAFAMQGLLANVSTGKGLMQTGLPPTTAIAQASVNYADAMLAELGKPR